MSDRHHIDELREMLSHLKQDAEFLYRYGNPADSANLFNSLSTNDQKRLVYLALAEGDEDMKNVARYLMQKFNVEAPTMEELLRQMEPEDSTEIADSLNGDLDIQEPPFLSEDEVTDFGKVTVFVGWFVEHDPAVNTFIVRASNIYHKDIFPSFWDRKYLREILLEYGSEREFAFGDWFIAKTFGDLNSMDCITREHFMSSIDTLNEVFFASTDELWRIAKLYNLRGGNILIEAEVQEIPNPEHMSEFLQNLIDACCVGAEMRILNWLYEMYFKEEYKPHRTEIEDVLRKWNKDSTEEVYRELRVAGALEDVARTVIADKHLLEKYLALRHELREKGIPNRSALLRIAGEMEKLIAQDENE